MFRQSNFDPKSVVDAETIALLKLIGLRPQEELALTFAANTSCFSTERCLGGSWSAC
jgi:hypothetical protein